MYPTCMLLANNSVWCRWSVYMYSEGIKIKSSLITRWVYNNISYTTIAFFELFFKVAGQAFGCKPSRQLLQDSFPQTNFLLPPMNQPLIVLSHRTYHQVQGAEMASPEDFGRKNHLLTLYPTRMQLLCIPKIQYGQYICINTDPGWRRPGGRRSHAWGAESWTIRPQRTIFQLSTTTD